MKRAFPQLKEGQFRGQPQAQRILRIWEESQKTVVFVTHSIAHGKTTSITRSTARRTVSYTIKTLTPRNYGVTPIAFLQLGLNSQKCG